MAGLGRGIVWPHPYFDGAAERREPNREPIDGHAVHPAAQHFGKRRLVGIAQSGRRLLCQLARLDRGIDGADQGAFDRQFLDLGR